MPRTRAYKHLSDTKIPITLITRSFSLKRQVPTGEVMARLLRVSSSQSVNTSPPEVGQGTSWLEEGRGRELEYGHPEEMKKGEVRMEDAYEIFNEISLCMR